MIQQTLNYLLFRFRVQAHGFDVFWQRSTEAALKQITVPYSIHRDLSTRKDLRVYVERVLCETFFAAYSEVKNIIHF